ncbi:hypothetical protein HID58_029936, partial [Brassica napus]
ERFGSHSPPLASSSSSIKGDSDQNVMNTLKNLGNSTLDTHSKRGQVQARLMGNISKTNLVEMGQATATTSLKERTFI